MNAVIAMHTIFGTVRTFLLYGFLLAKRHSLLENIWRAHSIWRALRAFAVNVEENNDNDDEYKEANVEDKKDDTLALDKDGRRMVYVKLTMVCVQLIIVAAILYLHIYFKTQRSVLDHCIVGFIMFGSEGLTLALSCMYATALIVILQLMRCINGPLEHCMRRVQVMQAEAMRLVFDANGDGSNGTRQRQRCRTRLGHAMRVQAYCDLSDTVDALSVLYGRVVEFVHGMAGVFGVHVLLTLMNAFLTALVQLLFIYVDVRLWAGESPNGRGAHFNQAFGYDALLFGFHVLEVAGMVWLTYGVQKEGQRMGLALYEVALDMDERLTESVCWLGVMLIVVLYCN